ncbi:MAG TPA: hypothetical protein DDZ76_06290 [Xanthomonadales bacterium]|nr:hypothetical protein [Xanthomonadales bacterium]
MLTARAPGKLIVLGEYAVLDGAPALVQAIDRQTEVRVSWRPGRPHRLRALPVAPQPVGFDFDGQGRVQWCDDSIGPSLAYVTTLLNALGSPMIGSDGGLDVVIDTRDCFDADTGEKLGLGSSAALAVALAGAWQALASGPGRTDPAPRDCLDRMIALHRDIQGGQGSGADVAASVFGGLIAYRPGAMAEVESLVVPEGVEWMWIWLGRSASTTNFLAGMAGYRHRRGDDCQRRMATMADLAEAGLRAVRRADGSALLAIIDAYGRAMADLGEAAGLPIWTDDHRRLAQWATRHGIAFKPSGAGGGDIAMAAATDIDALAGLARHARTSGYRVLPLAASRAGLHLQWHTASES